MTWEELQSACEICTKCALHETRTNVVFGCGNKNAEVLFVGEGPGQNEDLQGEPFVGRAGKLLDDMLKIIGLSRTENIYIANIVKCRPPKNRDPLNIEQEACMDWLRAQFSLMQPKIVVCLGRISAMAMIRMISRSRRSTESGLTRTACSLWPYTIRRRCFATRTSCPRRSRI
jgi:DNA polymerase